MSAPSGEAAELTAAPIGMFDSGIGGLTVLHECLVHLPAEDFVYFGDTARFPYGEKSQQELIRFSGQVAAFLERLGVKLMVVACNSATAGALPALQARFATLFVDAVMPGARAAVHSSRFRRIGVLATEATVSSGSYQRAIRQLDAGAQVFMQACPGLASLIERGDVASQELVDAVRTFTAPFKQQAVDVVIMGCTHYPLVRPMLQRHLGPHVTLVSSAEEIAREVTEILARQGIARQAGREGSYRFFCTGDPEEFRTVGARFLQMPLDRVTGVTVEELERETSRTPA